jgi:hypothetical protein
MYQVLFDKTSQTSTLKNQHFTFETEQQDYSSLATQIKLLLPPNMYTFSDVGERKLWSISPIDIPYNYTDSNARTQVL